MTQRLIPAANGRGSGIVGAALLMALIALVPTPGLATITATCGADAVANTATVLCAPTSGPCNATSVTVNDNVQATAAGCEFDLGGRAVTFKKTFEMAGVTGVVGGFIKVRNASSITVGPNARLKARGDFFMPFGFIMSGGLIALASNGPITIDGVLDVTGDSAGDVSMDAVGDITLDNGSSIVGNGLTVLDAGDRDADGGSFEATTTTGSITVGGTISLGGTNQASGGTVDFTAAHDITINQPIDATGGGFDGGEVDFSAGDDIIVARMIDVSSNAGGGSGGTIDMAAGEDEDGGLAPGGSLTVQAAVLKLNGSATDTTAGDGGELDVAAAGTIRFTGSGVGIRANAPNVFDGDGGDISMDSSDFFGDTISALDGDLVLDGSIIAGSGGAGGDGGSLDLTAGRDLTITATIDMSGNDGGGDISGDAGGAVLLNGTITSNGTLNTGDPGSLDFTAGDARFAGLTVSKNLVATGGALDNYGQSISLAGCSVSIGPGVTIDGSSGVPPGGSSIDLIARAPLQIGAGAQLIALPSGVVSFYHPPGQVPVVGSGVVSSPPAVDQPVAPSNFPYPNCPVCGDGILQRGEPCDPGIDSVCCSASCQLTCPTPTPTPTATRTRTPVATHTATPTSTTTIPPPSPTTTFDATATATATPTSTATVTAIVTAAPTSTATVTPAPTSTSTTTPSPSRTATVTATPTAAPTASATVTPIPTATASATPSSTITPPSTGTATPTPLSTATVTATATPTVLPTATRTSTPIATTTRTSTPVASATATLTRTATATPSATATPIASATATASATPIASATATATATAVATSSTTPSASPSPTASTTPPPSPSATIVVSATPTPAVTPTAPAPTATVAPTSTPDDMTAAERRALATCQLTVQKAARSFTSTDTRALWSCAERWLKCVQTKTGEAQQSCLAAARSKCAATVAHGRALAATKLAATVAGKCGSTKLASVDVLGEAGLDFLRLDGTWCDSFGGGGDSLAGITTCLTRSLSCRSERTVALSMPRAADFLSDAGLSTVCLPAASGDLSGWPDPAQGGKATKCQAAIDKASLGLGQKALVATEKCLDLVLRCRLSSPTPTACLAQAAPRCQSLLGRVTTGADSVIAGERLAIARVCGGVPIAQLLTTSGLGFDLAADRCTDLGVGDLSSPVDVATCVLRDQRCAVADVSRDATPRIDEYFADVGASLAPDDFVCPSVSTLGAIRAR